MTRGERIKKSRKYKGYTQQELADVLGLSVMTIRRFESNTRQPKLEMLEKIASALDVTVEKLLFGTDTVEKHFGEQLKNVREEKGFTQTELAQMVGVKTNTIIQYENGNRMPTREMLINLSECLNVSTLDIGIMDWAVHITQNQNDNGMTERVLIALDKLNTQGKQIAAERVEELTEIQKYTAPDTDNNDPG